MPAVMQTERIDSMTHREAAAYARDVIRPHPLVMLASPGTDSAHRMRVLVYFTPPPGAPEPDMHPAWLLVYRRQDWDVFLLSGTYRDMMAARGLTEASVPRYRLEYLDATDERWYVKGTYDSLEFARKAADAFRRSRIINVLTGERA